MKKITLTTLLFFFCTALVFAEPEIKGTPLELSSYLKDIPRIVALDGFSEIKVQADKAVVHISIETEDDSLQKALKLNQDIRSMIFKALIEAGVSNNNIKASKFSSTPQYGFWGEKPKSYEVVNRVMITILNEKQFQKIAELVDGNLQVEYSGVEFKHSDEDTLKDKVLEEAVGKVDKKKSFYESKLGIKLYPKSFSERRHVTDKTTDYLNIGRKRYSYEASLNRQAPSAKAIVLDEAAIGSSFDELIFTGYITVEYEVKQSTE